MRAGSWDCSRNRPGAVGTRCLHACQQIGSFNFKSLDLKKSNSHPINEGILPSFHPQSPFFLSNIFTYVHTVASYLDVNLEWSSNYETFALTEEHVSIAPHELIDLVASIRTPYGTIETNSLMELWLPN